MTPAPPSNQVIEVTLAFKKRDVLPGAAIPLVVTLRNSHPTQKALVHSPQADMQFIFNVEPDHGAPFHVSREIFMQRTMRDLPPPRVQEMAGLSPGASLDFPVDLAQYLLSPLSPGSYKVTATYISGAKRFHSAPATFLVVGPKASILEIAPDGGKAKLGSVMLHRGSEGKAAFYTRESEPGMPGSGTLQAWDNGPAEAERMTIATDAEGVTESRWVGWSEAGKATFLHLWASTQLHVSAPIELPEGAKLASPGWTFNDGSVMFAAAGNAAVTVIGIPNHHDAPVVKSIEIAGGIARPEQTRFGVFWIAAPKTDEAAVVEGDEPVSAPASTRRILAVWPDGERLLASTIDPAKVEASEPRELARQQTAAILALDVVSVAREGTPAICALVAGKEKTRHWIVQVQNEDSEPLVHELQPLPEGSGDAQEWAVLCSAGTAVAAVRTAKNRILYCTASKAAAGWKTIATAAEGRSFSLLRLAALQEPWAVWEDSSEGFQYRPLSN